MTQEWIQILYFLCISLHDHNIIIMLDINASTSHNGAPLICPKDTIRIPSFCQLKSGTVLYGRFCIDC